MRTLFVMTEAEIGGAERFVATLGAHWPAGEHRSLVILMGRGALSPTLDRSFDEVHYLGYPPTSRNLIGMVRDLERVIAVEQPDIISSHLFHADLVTLLVRSRTPKTTTVHTQGFGPADHPLTKAIARVIGLASARFAAVIPASDSPAMAEFLKRLRMRRVVEPIRNGTDIPAERVFSTGSRSFVSIARNHPVKGHQILFDAFGRIAADYPEWRLRAVGPAVTTAELAPSGRRARQLLAAGRISLEGPTDHPEQVLAEASALVISSLYGEAFPIVGAEAAAAGVPVITTRVGSCPEFADDPQFVVSPNSVDELAEAMARYAALTDEQRDELSVLARQRAERHYSPAAVVGSYRRLFSRLIRENSRG